MSRKQTKDIKFTIQQINQLLRTKKVQDNEELRKTLCLLAENILLAKHMYHGFNYFEPSVVYEDILVLAGKETKLIQYYTSKGGTI